MNIDLKIMLSQYRFECECLCDTTRDNVVQRYDTIATDNLFSS